MLAPRCSLPDIIGSEDMLRKRRRRKRYALSGLKWHKTDLTWRCVSCRALAVLAQTHLLPILINHICLGFFGSLQVSQTNMLLSRFPTVSTATHHPRCHPRCPTVWWTAYWAMPSKLGAPWPPWTSIACRQTTKEISECLLTACSTMTGTPLMARVAPWPTPSSLAERKWLETHTLTIKRSGAMEVGISSSLFKGKCDGGGGINKNKFCFLHVPWGDPVVVFFPSGVLRWQQQHRLVHSCRARVWSCVRTVPFLLWPVHHEAVLRGWREGHR